MSNILNNEGHKGFQKLFKIKKPIKEESIILKEPEELDPNFVEDFIKSIEVVLCNFQQLKEDYKIKILQNNREFADRFKSEIDFFQKQIVWMEHYKKNEEMEQDEDGFICFGGLLLGRRDRRVRL